MKTKCVKIKLKPGSLDRVRAWAKEINARSSEALATLRDEGVMLESVFLDQTSEGDFLIYYMRALDFAAATDVAKISKHDIDAFHAQFKTDCWESGQRLALLVDLSIEGSGPDQEPNQPVQHNAGSRPSSADSPASETPSSLGPRG